MVVHKEGKMKNNKMNDFKNGVEILFNRFLTYDIVQSGGEIGLKICDEREFDDRVFIHSGSIYLKPKENNNSDYESVITDEVEKRVPEKNKVENDYSSYYTTYNNTRVKTK